MSAFTRQAIDTRLVAGSDTESITLASLWWEAEAEGSGIWVEVPKGTPTNFASVPRPLWSFIKPSGRHSGGSIVHDYLYSFSGQVLWGHRGRKWADDQFRLAMLAKETPKLKAWIMWASVRMFGWHRYDRVRRDEVT